MKIGVIAESFRKPFPQAIKEARALGADGVQAYAGRAFPFDADKSKLSEIKKITEGEGLCFSAICGDFGCAMYYERDRSMIDREKRILEMAKELGTDVVTTHIGVVPENKDCVQYESMYAVCKELADFAKSLGGHFAVETKDMDEFDKKFKDFGGEYMYEPYVMDEAQSKIAFIKDPDGNEIEIMAK